MTQWLHMLTFMDVIVVNSYSRWVSIKSILSCIRNQI